MKKSQFESLIREVIRETIRKVDDKYVVYPEKGGKRLGTHSTKSAAEKQLTAIHLNKEVVIKDRVYCDNCSWNWKISEGGKDVYLCHKCGHDNTPRGERIYNQVKDKVKPPVDWEKRDWELYDENYADGKVKGKSRPGRVKKAGASCKGSVTDLRAKAKKYGGEKGKMYHWCANMKSGRKKK